MKKLMVLLFAGFVVAACSSAPQVPGDKNSASVKGAPSGNLSPTSAAAETTPPGSAGANNSSSSSLPLAITVRPPIIVFGPIQGSPGSPAVTPPPFAPAGWLTYTSSTLGAAVDYPADWTVADGADGTTFTSPQGAKILLQAAGTAAGSTAAGAGSPQCTALVNVSGLTASVCVDSASGRYSATFDLNPAGGSAQELTLSTTDSAALEVYKAMINSLRPAL